MRTLVIDCATPAFSLALFDGDKLLCGHHEELGRGHAEAVVPAIARLMGTDRADRICVDIGPGSFTGIRVGLAAARALGLAWQVPVSGFGSLALCAAIARSRDKMPQNGSIAIVLTGGHGELFWQRFDRATLMPLAAERSSTPEVLAAILPEHQVWGSGAAVLVEARGAGEARDLLPDARLHPLLPAGIEGNAASARYGRGADATPMRRKADDLRLAEHDDASDPAIPAIMRVMDAAFDPAFGEAWTASQLRSMLDLPGACLVSGSVQDDIVGFGLFRAIAGESELLLLAVRPDARRGGHGAKILQRCVALAKGSGAETMFLEVREDNEAIAFYRQAGFERYSSRPDYYVGRDGRRRTALSFRLLLRTAAVY